MKRSREGVGMRELVYNKDHDSARRKMRTGGGQGQVRLSYHPQP